MLAADQTVAVLLENYNNPSGTAWFDDVVVQQIQPAAADVFLLSPPFRGMLFYDQPQTPFVASFVGSANVLAGRVDGGRATLGTLSVAAPAGFPDGAGSGRRSSAPCSRTASSTSSRSCC